MAHLEALLIKRDGSRGWISRHGWHHTFAWLEGSRDRVAHLVNLRFPGDWHGPLEEGSWQWREGMIGPAWRETARYVEDVDAFRARFSAE